jgi:hypothetical protein
MGQKSEHDGEWRVSTQAIRTARIKAHAAFDEIWKSGSMTRGHAYHWLSTEMGMERQTCHIGHFDEEQCARVIELVEAEQAFRRGNAIYQLE